MNESRKEFERHLNNFPSTLENATNQNIAWQAWQASRRAALLDAAKRLRESNQANWSGEAGTMVNWAADFVERLAQEEPH